jgi:hypothetical protein
MYSSMQLSRRTERQADRKKGSRNTKRKDGVEVKKKGESEKTSSIKYYLLYYFMTSS